MKIYPTLFLFILSIHLTAQDMLIIPFESTWKYLDNGSNQSTDWRFNTYDDTSWSTGPAILGYGEGDEGTVVSYGPDPNDRHITTYFRHYFNIDDIDLFKNFLLKLKKDDAAIVYVNGEEVMRSNFGEAGYYGYNAESYSTISSEEEDIIWEKIISPTFFNSGENMIAVEVHQTDAESSDLIFDLELIGLDDVPSLYWSPYLQKATPNGITIKWRTDIPTDSKLWFGADVNNFSSVLESATETINHEVDIDGLEADSKYYYKIGNSESEFAGGTTDYFFNTLPDFGTVKPTRIWVTGDAGTGKDEQINVRNAYSNFAGSSGKADLWLMLGDNAYEHGREADYNMGLFTKYPDILRNTVSFPATGNHDLIGGANAETEIGTFYEIFALPKNGESGGIPSNKESYFSVDYGNIHLICLESYDLDRDSTAAMATWLKEDLQNTNADWLIAYWHFPPYSKVSHDTDDPTDFSGRSTEMRKNFNPILEQYGIDLVLCGHSHAYERSFLIDGHYGVSSTLTQDMILDASSGDMNQTGAYSKPDELLPHKGTVYVVCGGSGKLSSPLDDGPHAAMYETNTDFSGSVIIDIEDDVLECKFLNEQGIIQDYFHIQKEKSNAIEEIEDQLKIEVYPNPTEDTLNIKIPKEYQLKNGKVEIYSRDGKLIRAYTIGNTEINQQDFSFALEGFNTGTYTVKILDGKKHLESKLLVVK